MAEILLALGPDDVSQFRHIGNDVIEQFLGVKVLTNEAYNISHYDNNNPFTDYSVMSQYARVFDAEKICIDAKIGNDSADEITKTVGTIVSRVVKPPVFDEKKKDKPRREQPHPDFITALLDLPQSAIEEFLELSELHKFEPVLHLTSSRFTEQDFINRGTTAEKNAIWRTKLAKMSGFKKGFVICAGADVEVIVNENPDLKPLVTGAMLNDTEEDEPSDLRHPRNTLIEPVKQFAYAFIEGSPILKSANPREASLKRIEAVKN